MLRLITCSLLISTVCACGKDSKKEAAPAPQPGELLTPSELSTPSLPPLSKEDAERAVKNDPDLFELQRPEEPADKQLEGGCFRDFFAKHPVRAAGGHLQMRYTTDEGLVTCFMNALVASIKDAAAKSNGTITVTPSDPKKTSEQSCAEATNDGSSELGRAGSETQSDVYAEADLSQYAGKSMLDLPKDDGVFMPARAMRTVTQMRQLNAGEVCKEKRFGRFTTQRLYSESCSVMKGDDGAITKSCDKVTIKRLVSVDAGPFTADELRAHLENEETLTEKSEQLVRRKGARFPESGKKTIVLRNWHGTITFGGDGPRYELTDGTETISGTYAE